MSDARDDYDSPDPEEDANRYRRQRCKCGDDLPGRCPGPSNCPYNQPEEKEDDE